jgi:hypothetical protein
MASTPPSSLQDLAAWAEKLSIVQSQLQKKITASTAPAGTQLRFKEEAEFGQPREVAAGTSGLSFFVVGKKEDGTDRF